MVAETRRANEKTLEIDADPLVFTIEMLQQARMALSP